MQNQLAIMFDLY